MTSPKLAPKQTLSKRQIAEMHTIEIGMVEIKIAEDTLRGCMNNHLYDNLFFVSELYTSKRQLESFGNCNVTFDHRKEDLR